MSERTVSGAGAPGRTRVLAALVGASVALGLLAALDPTTLRPGGWTVVFVSALTGGALAVVALLTVGRRWPDPVLGVLISALMGLVVLSVLANQSRSGGILNVVLLLPNAVYAAVHLSPRVCRAVMVVLTASLAAVMWAIAGSGIQWLTLTALPLLAFLGTTEVVLRQRSDLGGALEALRRQSLTDPLTGLLNRRALQDRLDGAPGSATGVRTVLVLDVDRFKAVNDTLGHAVGDEVLRRFSAGLARETRADDVVVRMGGEEFLVLSTTPAEHAEEFAETLRARAAVWMGEWSVTVSVGAVSATRPAPGGLVGAALEAAVLVADSCLYAAKERGRDRVVLALWPDGHPAVVAPVGPSPLA